MRIPGTPQAGLGGPRVGVNQPDTTAPLRGLANDLDDVAIATQRLASQRDHTYLVDAQNEYDAAMTGYSLEQQQRRTGASAGGFTEDYKKEHQRVYGDISSRMATSGLSPRGQNAFKAWAEGRSNIGQRQAALYEHGQMQAHAKDAHSLRVNEVMTGLGQTPESWPDAFRQLEESYALAVGQGIYRPEEAQTAFNVQKEKAKVTAFDNLYAKDRELAMGSIAALGLSEEQRARAEKRYQADLKADEAAAKAKNADALAALKMQVDAVDYLAKQSGEVADLRAVATAMTVLGEKEMGIKLNQRADLYENNVAAIKESQAMSLPELAGKINDVASELPEVLAEEGSAVELAARHKRGTEELKLRVNIYEERLKKLKDDPAGAVAATADAELPAGQEENLSLRTDMRLAAQEANGVPFSLRKTLTNNEAAAFKEAWQSGDLATRLNIAASIRAFGQHAGNVAGEIGLSPTEQIVIAQAERSPQAVTALNTVITAGSLKGEELPKLERADALAREAAEGSEVIKGYRAAAAAMPGLAPLQMAVRDLENNMGKLVRMKGGDVSAACLTIDGRLKALADGNFALVYDPAIFAEPKALEDTLTRRQRGPALDELANGRRFADDFERQNWLEHMRRSGIWLNAPDGDGYILFDPVAQAPAMDDDRNVIRVRNSEVSSIEVVDDTPESKDWDALSWGQE